MKEINDCDAVIAGKDAEIAPRLAQIAHHDSEMLVQDLELVWSEGSHRSAHARDSGA